MKRSLNNHSLTVLSKKKEWKSLLTFSTIRVVDKKLLARQLVLLVCADNTGLCFEDYRLLTGRLFLFYVVNLF